MAASHWTSKRQHVAQPPREVHVVISKVEEAEHHVRHDQIRDPAAHVSPSGRGGIRLAYHFVVKQVRAPRLARHEAPKP